MSDVKQNVSADETEKRAEKDPALKKQEPSGEVPAEETSKNADVSTALLSALKIMAPDIARTSEKLFGQLTDERLIKAYFLCFLYQMPLLDVMNMFQSGLTERQVIEKRNAFLIKRTTDQDAMTEVVQEALKEVRSLVQENQQVRKIFETEVSAMTEELKASSERERKVLEEQIMLLKERLNALEVENAEIKQKLNEAAALSEGMAQKASEEDKNRFAADHSDYGGNNSSSGFAFGIRRRRRGRSRQEKEMSEFQERYLRNPAFSKEQKAYLLSCMEEGCSIRVINRIAMKELSVEQMKKWRKVIEKRTTTR